MKVYQKFKRPLRGITPTWRKKYCWVSGTIVVLLAHSYRGN